MGHGHYIAPAKGQYQVAAGQVLELQFVVLPGESRDIDVTVDLCGPGAEAHLKGLYLCKADEKVNFRVVMHHKAPGCHSTQLFNGIAGGSAEVSFDGTIVVAPDAQKTEAFQENHRSWRFMPMTSSARTAPRWASSTRTNSSTCAPAASPRPKPVPCRYSLSCLRSSPRDGKKK